MMLSENKQTEDKENEVASQINGLQGEHCYMKNNVVVYKQIVNWIITCTYRVVGM